MRHKFRPHESYFQQPQGIEQLKPQQKHPAGSVTGVRKWSKLLRPHSGEPVFAFKTSPKKGPSTLGMTTLPWLQPQKGQPQLFLTFSSTCQRWLPSGFSLRTPTATGKSACISIFEDCKHFPIQHKTSRTYPSNTKRSPFWRIRKYEGKER